MSKTILLFLGTLLIYFSIPVGVFAKTYKCIDENGEVTYSQTGCKKKQKANQVMSSKTKEIMEDCKYAGLFAKDVVRQMRSNIGANQLYEYYGGISKLSKSTKGIINYVYSFKYTADTPIEKIASFAVSKCNARSFGRVICEDFPEEFQYKIYSCDDEERQQALELNRAINQNSNEREFSNVPPEISVGNSSNKKNKPQQRSVGQKEINATSLIQECKQSYESEIEQIDNRLRQQYSPSLGDRLREKRRKLSSKKFSECR